MSTLVKSFLFAICAILFVPNFVHAGYLDCFATIFGKPLVDPHPGFISNQEILGEIAAAAGKKIEIGAADTPFCPGCTQVDKYKSQYDLFESMLAERLGRKPTPEEVEADLRKAGAGQNSHEPWVAAKNGYIADADHLPFASQSTGAIFSKNFPWHSHRTPDSFIESVLKEYKRVLMPGGHVFLLAALSKGTKNFERHAQIAKSLGFKIDWAQTETNTALILTKKP